VRVAVIRLALNLKTEAKGGRDLADIDALGALVAAPGQRLVPAQAAAALAVSPVMLRGAVLHVQRLLNVEGYPVLRVDADGSTVVLDEALLREQFGVRA